MFIIEERQKKLNYEFLFIKKTSYTFGSFVTSMRLVHFNQTAANLYKIIICMLRQQRYEEVLVSYQHQSSCKLTHLTIKVQR